MPKTVELIKAEVTALVKSQGNQGAISLGTVLDDITELAGEGGGGGSTPNVIQISSADNVNWTIDNPDDLEGFAEKAGQGELIVLQSTQQFEQQTVTSVGSLAYSNIGGAVTFKADSTLIEESGVSVYSIIINVEQKTVTTQLSTYPSN